MVRNSWRSAFEDKTAPAPTELLTERDFRSAFVDVVASDFIGTDSKIYGIPLSADSLALYYNKDLFNAAGISQAPETWDEVARLAGRLTSLDQFGNITLSGVALGTGTNINRSSDILTAMMLQLGSEIKEPKKSGRVSFIDQPSRQALDYYTQFAKIGSPAYTWNARQHYSIDSFYEGTTAMMINYSWQYDTIKQKNAKLNIGVAPLPQFNTDAPVNVANYWGYAVSKENSKEVDPFAPKTTTPVDPEKENYLRTFEAWQFLKFLTMEGNDKKMTLINGLAGTTKEATLEIDPTAEYLAKTKKPAARRDILEEQQKDVRLAPFAYGNLIAKNWYQGNPEAVDGIFVDMIEAVVRGEKSSQDALSTAANRINLLSR
jgi:ABC-type glycerol-3-phosphate transport system substrate-binding protein